jgi:hypothetical protein
MRAVDQSHSIENKKSHAAMMDEIPRIARI